MSKKKPKHQSTKWKSRAKGWLRRHKKSKPPMEMLIGAATIPFIPAFADYPQNSIFTAMKQGDAHEAAKQAVKGFINMDIDSGQIDLMGLINPFDFNGARYTKVLMWSGIAGTVRKKLAPKSTQLIQKIPIVGKMVS